MLKEHFGADFETTHPYVMASWNKKKTSADRSMAGNVFHHHITRLVMELRGETFHPHKIRHIVATYLVEQGEIGYAAEVLGDTPEVVMREYYRPDNKRAKERYLARRGT